MATFERGICPLVSRARAIRNSSAILGGDQGALPLMRFCRRSSSRIDNYPDSIAQRSRNHIVLVLEHASAG
jgi:hypothetical protein